MSVRVGLSAVIVALKGESPLVLARPAHGMEAAALPFGPFDPQAHRTFELGLRGWVLAQTGFDPGYVEQLYTFGDRGRELPGATLGQAGGEGARVISVGYVALTREAAPPGPGFDADWLDWYRLFPWEDHRAGRPLGLDGEIMPALTAWAGADGARLARVEAAFAGTPEDWAEDRVLERYELLYEAGLVAEQGRDAGAGKGRALAGTGEPMASDHRRILATAMSRLRGKLRYRPILFELMAERFTLGDLQRAAEAVLGLSLHKQNFRRALDKTGLVAGTGVMVKGTGGRPAELFRLSDARPGARARLGLPTPVLREGG